MKAVVEPHPVVLMGLVHPVVLQVVQSSLVVALMGYDGTMMLYSEVAFQAVAAQTIAQHLLAVVTQLVTRVNIIPKEKHVR